jgi:hypothetical protein
MPTSPGPIRTMLANMSPTWMSRDFGKRLVLGILGYVGDWALESATLAVKASWLQESTSPDDALDLQSTETGIRRYPSEAASAHRSRAIDPWNAWEFAGSKEGYGATGQGLDGQLHLLGYPNAFTVADYEWSLPDPVLWSRFWVIIPETDHSWQHDGTWADPGDYDDGGVWDATATVEEIRALRILIRQWKSGHEICVSIIALMGGEDLWDYPAGIWSDPGNWDDGDEPLVFSPV